MLIPAVCPVCKEDEISYDENHIWCSACGWAKYGKTKPVEQKQDSPRVARLKSGNWNFGCSSKHYGDGSEGCPKHVPHHHHDMFCSEPSLKELSEAGIDYADFRKHLRVR